MEAGVEGDYTDTYQYTVTTTENDHSSCGIKMGSDERHFTESFSMESDGQSHKTVSTNHKL